MGKPESHVEDYLRKRVQELGGRYRKVTYQGRRGAPDQWCFFPDGLLLIVECKSDAGELEPIQKHEIRTLRAMGQKVFVAYSRPEVDEILARYVK